jgi:hypothetical protein
MLPVHTQKSLDKLTWSEIQKLHKSLGLKAAPNTRTRRDLQNNIVAAMPQPVTEAEQIATPLTCATCPLAVLIEDNRYECGHTYSKTRGHWEAKDDCYEAVADAQPEVTVELVAELEAPIASQEVTTTQATTIAQTPHAHVEESIIVAMTKRTPFQEKMDKLDYLYELEMKAQLAIEATIIGSKEEAEAYRYLRKIERDIEFHNRPASELPPSPTIQQLQNQMDELKQDIARKSTLSLFKIEAFDPSILPTDEPEQLSEEIEEPKGTIHWESPASGTITGSKGNRKFYVRNNEIFVMFPGDFTAAEGKRPNIRHQQIRAAIESGRAFDPKAFKDSPNFFQNTEVCNGGCIRQECDGHWWAWKQGGITGHPFFQRQHALEYLDRTTQA